MKKVMLNASLLLLALFLSAGAVWAQSHGHHRGGNGNPFKAIEELEEELQLTPEQEKAIEELKQETRSAYKEARKAEHTRKQSMHQSLKSELDAILTAEQTALLEAHHEAKKAEAKAMREEMRDYHKQNVAPVLLEQRKKLEAKISDEDKAALVKIRAERKASRPQKDGGQKADSRPHKDELSALVQKYDEEINTLMEEIKPKREQWEKDMKTIAEANAPERTGKKGMRKGKQRSNPGFQKARFLLMDPVKGPEIEDNDRY
jgi:Spy/CpxP family protein refolding chaperone